MPPFSHILQYLILFAEITLVKAFETFAVASLVLAHLVYRIVDSIEVQFLGQRSDTLLILAGAAFRLHTRFHIGFGIPNHFAQQFCELRGMLGLFP